jgi:hypothetical protein
MSTFTVRSTLDRIRASLVAFGLINGLLYLLGRGLERLTNSRFTLIKYYLVAQPIPQAPVAPRHTQAGFQVVQVAPGDSLVAAFPRSMGINQGRFARGAQCFAICKQERFVGHIWIAKGQYCEDEVRCLYVLDPPDRAVWDFDVYLESAYRFTRAFAQLWDGVNAALSREGFQWTLSRISAFNPSSLIAHKRLGLVQLHTAVFLCAGRAQFALFTCRPYVHVSYRPGQCPTVKLRIPTPHTP